CSWRSPLLVLSLLKSNSGPASRAIGAVAIGRKRAGAQAARSLCPQRMRSSASVEDADRPHVSRTRGALATDFDPDRALDHVEFADVDANAAHPCMPQKDRGDLLGERLDKIDMAAPDHEADGVENDVVGENRPHVVRVRSGAAHHSLDVEDDALTDRTLEIIGADGSGNDEVVHEHTVEFAFLVS